MIPHRSTACLCLSTIILACLLTTVPAQETTKGAAQSKRAEIPLIAATGSKEALQLARRTLDYAGGRKGLSGVHNMIWTYSLQDRTIRVFWDRKASKVRFEFLHWSTKLLWRTPKPLILVHDLTLQADLMVVDAPEQKLVKGIDWPKPKELPGSSYWRQCSRSLLAPFRLLDRGVSLSIDPREEDDAGNIQRLRVRYPALVSSYVMHVEKDTGRIQSEETLDKRSVVRRHRRYEDYRKIGWLMISLSRREIPVKRSKRKPIAIRLSEVAINVPPPKNPWTTTKFCLAKVGVPGSSGKPHPARSKKSQLKRD